MTDDIFEETTSPEFIDFDNRPFMKAFKADLKAAASKLGRWEVAYLVKTYYEFQGERIRANNRIKAYEKNNSEPISVLDMFGSHFSNLEKLMIIPLKEYAENDDVGDWLLSLKGIGPVLAAGLLAYFDVTKAEVGSHFVSYAGLDNTLSWDNKLGWLRRVPRLTTNGQKTLLKHKTQPIPIPGSSDIYLPLGRKQPFSREAKTLCFKVAKSFVMSGGGEFYNEIYKNRKIYETHANENKKFAEQAYSILLRMRKKHESELDKEVEFDQTAEEVDTDIVDSKTYMKTLEKGMLVPAHIDARCRRWMVKIFLSHLYEVMYEFHYKRKAPPPYALRETEFFETMRDRPYASYLDHAHNFPVPNYISPYKR